MTTTIIQKVKIQHLTQYSFEQATSIMPHVVRLRPAPHCRVPIEFYELTIKPENHSLNWQQDPFSNYLARIFFPEKSDQLIFQVDLVAELIDLNPFDFFLEENADTFPFEYEETLKAGLAPYLKTDENSLELIAWIKTIDRTPQATINFLGAVNTQLHAHLNYQTRLEEGVQSCQQTLNSKTASCRDSAWLLLQIFRHLGLAARFVSGYQIQLLDEKEDCADLHAWTEVYIPGAGWLGLDPSTGLFAAGTYIPLACTPEPQSAAPVTGATGPSKVDFKHSSTVTSL